MAGPTFICHVDDIINQRFQYPSEVFWLLAMLVSMNDNQGFHTFSGRPKLVGEVLWPAQDSVTN
jgi:hypothetical protein